MKMSLIAVVGIGGGLGAMLRYWLGTWISTTQWPTKETAGTWAILVINLLGCLAFGLLQGWVKPRPDPHLALFCLTGLLGGFTTFSTFGWDTYNLVSQGKWAWAVANVLLSVCGGLTAVAVGVWLAKSP